jgi:hypothetical protein
MLGLAYVIGLTIYAVILIAAILLGWRWGRSGNGSLLRGGLVAAIAGLLVYLPGFWNHIPVALEYRKLCDKDAGFTALVPHEEWVSANRSSFESLRGVDLQVTGPRRQTADGASEYEFFGSLLKRRSTVATTPFYGMTLIRRESLVLDTRTGAVLTRAIDYYVGPDEDARFWLRRRTCFPDRQTPFDLGLEYIKQIAKELK